MIKFAHSLFTGLILTIGVVSSAQAADKTFTVSLKIDKTASAEENYISLQQQAKFACKAELVYEGYRRRELAAGQKGKCEKQILSNAVSASNSQLLIIIHNGNSGAKLRIKKFAKK